MFYGLLFGGCLLFCFNWCVYYLGIYVGPLYVGWVGFYNGCFAL